MNDPQETNPYASPIVLAALVADDAEAIRRVHLSHEAEIRAVGWLYYFGAAIVVLFWLLFVLGIVPRDVDDSSARMLLGVIYFLVFILHVLLASGLRRLSTWVRWPVGVLSCVGLLMFPAGTLINIYVLYLLFSRKGWMVLSRRYQQVVAETPHLNTGIAWVFWALFAAFLGLSLLMISFVLLPIILEHMVERRLDHMVPR
jgi:hypothetical protein